MATDFAKRIMTSQDRIFLNCGEEYDITVENVMAVAECNNYSNTEEERMFAGLQRKLNLRAQEQCDLLGSTCPTPEIIDARITSNTCTNNIWRVELLVRARCIP